jgi:hypothetical protein
VIGISKENSYHSQYKRKKEKGGKKMNRKVVLLLMVCLMATTLLLASCGGTDLEEFAQKYIDAEGNAWAQGDTSDLEKLEDPNVVIHNASYGDTTGWDAHEQTILGTREMISGIQQEWEYLTGEGNHFAMAYKSHMTMPGETPDTSLEATNDSLFLFRLDKSRVVEIWINGNTMMTPAQAK